CCGPHVERFGGNTPCLEVRCGTERLIFDAGSGLRNLGHAWSDQGVGRAHMFLTHFHLDHVMGLPFFKPFFEEGNALTVMAGRHDSQCCLRNAIKRLFSPPLLPVCVDMFKAKVEFGDLSAGDTHTIGDGIKVRTAPLNHPDGATAYRVDYRDKSVSYVTDTEHKDKTLDENILKLIDGTDLFIYDAMFTDEEYEAHRGFGHSTFTQGLRLAEEAKVKKYIPFHHHPSHDDHFLERIEGGLRERFPGTVMAAEGLKLAA
ncbi:MAG: MBL fold metallo-hydrolase, partial [Pseudomonadota bacterium]